MGEKDETTIVQGEKKSKGAKKTAEPAATEDGGGEGGKKEEVPVDGDAGINTIIVLKLDLHCDGCAKKVKRSIKNYNGVEEVKVDAAGGKLTVKGNVDANWLRNKVELKTKKKVELVVASQTQSQSHTNKDAGAGGGGDKINPKLEKKNKLPHDHKLVDDNIIAKMPQDQDNVKANITQDKVKLHKKPDDNELIKKPDDNMPAPPKQLLQNQSSRVVLKIPLHCDGCAQKIRRIIKKIDGVDNVTIDNDKDLVTMEGTMDVKELLPFLKQKLKRSVDIVSPNKDNGGGVPTHGGGEKKGKETGGGGDNKEKTVGGGGSGGDKKLEKATSRDKENKEKAVGGGDVVQKKEKLDDGGGEEKKKKKDGGGGLDVKDKAAGGGDKKDKEANGGNKDNKEKEANTNGGGGGGKKEKSSGDGDGGGKKEKIGGEMKDIQGVGGQNRLSESKAVNNDGENKIKDKMDEPKVEVNRMEYQRYDAPYTHYGVPSYNQNYANQDYGLIHTMYNNPYHASTSYVTEYNHQPYNYQPYHHLHHVQQPQVPPPPPPTYLPPPQDHMFSDENPNACSTM